MFGQRQEQFVEKRKKKGSLPKEMFSFERLIPLHLKADLWQPEKKQIFVLVG